MRRAVLLCSITSLLPLLALACLDDHHGENVTTSDDGIAPIGDSETTGESNDPESADSGNGGGDGDGGDGVGDGDGDGDGGPGIKFDLAVTDTPPLEGQQTCGVDILFVVDNSGSMSDVKPDIVAAFSTFIKEVTTTVEPGTSVHVGVTRATGFFSPGNGSGWSPPTCEFIYIDGTWNPPTKQVTPVNGQQGRLFEFEGQRYYEFVAGEDTFGVEDWFHGTLAAAIAQDDSSNSESVVAAAAYPFHPINAEYNAGFSRPDAVLVLFLLSDAPDATPEDVSTQDLISMVTDAKPGCDETCVLPTGIVQAMCYGDVENTNTRLIDFMSGFDGPPAAIDYFTGNEPPDSFTSVLGATLAESIADTCELIVG